MPVISHQYAFFLIPACREFQPIMPGFIEAATVKVHSPYCYVSPKVLFVYPPKVGFCIKKAVFIDFHILQK